MLRSEILLFCALMCGGVFGGSDYSADLLLGRMTEVIKKNGNQWLNLPPFEYSDMLGNYRMSASRGNLVSLDSISRYNPANTTVYGLTLYLNIPMHWVGMTAQYSVSYSDTTGNCTYLQNATANEYDEPVITVWISAEDVARGSCFAELDQIQTNSIDDPTMGPPVPDSCGSAYRDELNAALSNRFLFDLHYTALSFLTNSVKMALDGLNLCGDGLTLMEGLEDVFDQNNGITF